MSKTLNANAAAFGGPPHLAQSTFPNAEQQTSSVRFPKRHASHRDTLTDAQLVLLSAAAAREDGRVVLLARHRGVIGRTLLAGLEARGMIEKKPDKSQGGAGVGLGRSVEDTGLTPYIIAASALRALGIENARAASDGEQAAEPQGPNLRKAEDDTRGSSIVVEAPLNEGEMRTDAGGPSSLSASRPAHGAAQLRAGSKIGIVLALLGKPEGATLVALMAATGWLPHTTRAALTGLRQRGHDLARAKNTDGMTIYRLIGTHAGKTSERNLSGAERGDADAEQNIAHADAPSAASGTAATA
jgi:hypothetical protein